MRRIDYTNALNARVNIEKRTIPATGVDNIALPVTAANTGMQVQLFGQSAENEAVNGNFENGLIAPFSKYDGGGGGASTLAINSSTPISGNYDVRLTIITPSTDPQRPFLRGLGRAANIGDKIYISFYAKILSGTPKIRGFHTGVGADTLRQGGDVINGRNSRILDAEGGSDSLGVIYFSSPSVWDMQMDNFMRINLTETFGAGNEPTKEQCDKLFANYFEGTANTIGTGRVRSVGKNLFDKSRANVGGVSVNSGNANTSYTNYRYTDYIPVIGGAQYRQNADTSGSSKLGAAFYDSNKQFISGETVSNSAGATITAPANAKYMRTCWHVVLKSIDEFQIERGTTETTYEPYRESILQLTTPPLRSNGLIKDEIRKGANGYELVKRISDTVILNGTENWGGFTDTLIDTISVRIFIDGIKNGGVNRSSFWANITQGASITDAEIMQVHAGALIVRINKSRLSTLDVPGFKAWLAANNQTINYELDTPTITPIAHAGLLNSNSNGTVYFEPAIKDIITYTDKAEISDTDYPISSIESIEKNGIAVNPATAVIAEGGLSLTHPDLEANDEVELIYFYNRESTGRGMRLLFYNKA